MRLSIAVAGVAALLAASAAEAATFKRGDWVLAQFQGGRYWFAAVVQGVSGDGVALLYDDGDRETRPANQVRPYDWRVGARVECNWQRGGKWYPGTIVKLNEAALSVAYDDGDYEDTGTGYCRTQ